MAVKVLVNAIGQQIIADVKQVENTDTKEVLAYWVKEPRLANYSSSEEGGISLRFSPYCLISDESEFSIRAEHIVSILEPTDAVVKSWEGAVYPPETAAPAETEIHEAPAEEPNESVTVTAEDGPHPDLAD